MAVEDCKMCLIKTLGIFIKKTTRHIGIKDVHMYVKFKIFIENNLQVIPYFAEIFHICTWNILYLLPGQEAQVPSVSNINWAPGNN